jgi:hypothetical protein
MKTLDTTSEFFTKEDATTKAAELNASDPDWTYTAVHDPKGTGFSFITIHDENGEFVAKL